MPRPTVMQAGMPVAVKINGRDLHDFGVLAYQHPQLSAPPLEVTFQTLPERHDAVPMSAAFRPRPFPITGRMLANSVADLRTNLDDMKYDASSVRGSLYSTPTPIRLEFLNLSDRFYPCYLAGGLQVESIGQMPTKDSHVNFTLSLMMLSPFAIATTLTEAAPSGSGPSFTVLDTGSAPSPFIVELEGAATAPDFVIADMSFYADFNWDLLATKIDGSTVTGSSGAGTLMDQFEPGEYEGRYDQQSTFTTSFGAQNIRTNPTEGTVIMVIRPQFAFDVASGPRVFEFWVDANNGVRLGYDSGVDKWAFAKEIGGVATSIGSGADAETFASDDPMVLAISWGAGNMKVYKDGVELDSGGNTSGFTGSGGTIYLGDQGEIARPDCKYDFLYMFPFQLSAADVRRFSLNPTLVAAHNTKKSKSDNLDADERSVIDFGKKTITNYTAVGVASNDLSNWDTNGFPLLRPKQVCFHVPSTETIGGIKVAYRKRWM